MNKWYIKNGLLSKQSVFVTPLGLKPRTFRTGI